MVISCSDNLNSEDDKVLKEFENSRKAIESRYQVKIPWSKNTESLNDNYSYTHTHLWKLVQDIRSIEIFIVNIMAFCQGTYLKELLKRLIKVKEVMILKSLTCHIIQWYAKMEQRKDGNSFWRPLKWSEMEFCRLMIAFEFRFKFTQAILIVLLQFRLTKVAINLRYGRCIYANSFSARRKRHS